MAKSFARPLVKYGGKKLDSIFQPGGYKAVGDAYRDKLGGNPFGIKPDEPLKPVWNCQMCGRVYDPNNGETSGICNGMCGAGY